MFFEIKNSVRISKVYVALVILSSIVAAIGLIESNIPVIIGAMAIAPFLGPNIATSFALVTADLNLGTKALGANALGIAIAFFTAIIIAYIFDIESSKELAKRAQISPSDFALAIISGIAGTLAFDTRLSTALIGVMVAVAILPPLVASGLFLGSGLISEAKIAFLLLLINLVSINLSSIVTFLIQKIKPREESKVKIAAKASWTAVIVWTVLLIVIIFISRQ